MEISNELHVQQIVKAGKFLINLKWNERNSNKNTFLHSTQNNFIRPYAESNIKCTT